MLQLVVLARDWTVYLSEMAHVSGSARNALARSSCFSRLLRLVQTAVVSFRMDLAMA